MLFRSTGAFTAAATLVKSNFVLGGHSLGFIYSGDTSVLASSRTGVGYAVSADATTSALTVFPLAGSVFGQQVVFTDKVTSQFGATPHGTVKFFNGTTLLFTTSLNIHGQAFFITSTLPVGTTGNISAQFLPPAGASFKPSTALLGGSTVASVSTATNDGGAVASVSTLTTPALASTAATATTAAANTFVTGDSVTIAGATQAEYNGTFTITVTSTTTFTYTLASGSTATTATGTITAQDHSQTTVTITTAAANGFLNGDSITIAGATQPAYNGTFVIAVTGATTFTYTITTSPVTPATGTITATKGNPTYTVAKANTTVGPPSSSNTHAIHGTAVTLTASVAAVSPGKGTPTGQVEFHDHGYTFTPTTGSSVTTPTTGTVLGTATLSGGVATLVLPTGLPAGVHQISADYLGDGNFNTSGPDATGGNTVLLGIHQLVEQVAVDNTTLITGSSSPNPSVGATVTFSATVVPASNPTGTGAIGFLSVLADVVFKEGTTVLGTSHCGFIPGVNEGLAKFTTSTLAIGKHTITATYKGNDLFGELPTPATSTAFVETVTPPVALNAALALAQPSGSTSFAATTRRHGTAPSQSLGAASLDQYFASTPSTTHSTRTLAGALARTPSNDDWLNGG